MTWWFGCWFVGREKAFIRSLGEEKLSFAGCVTVILTL